jgi:hypothetical protein
MYAQLNLLVCVCVDLLTSGESLCHDWVSTQRPVLSPHLGAALNSLPAIDAHERQRFNELCGTVVSCRIFIRSQSLIAR